MPAPEFSLYERAGKFIHESNKKLAVIEELDLSHVQERIKALEQADKILIPALAPGKRNEATEALATWDSDRTKSLYFMLHAVYIGYETKRFETAEISARCSRTLVTSPLIEPIKLKPYSDMWDIGKLMVDETRKKSRREREILPLVNAYFAGVNLNATLFCPEIFHGEVDETKIQAAQTSFSEVLNILQGKPAITH